MAYFDTANSIHSTVGLYNVLIGFMVAGATGGFSLLLLVPIVSSAAGALAGLSYYAWGPNHPASNHPVVNRAVAAGITQVAWMIQEGALPLYGCMILVPILHNGERLVFLILFWVLMLVFVTLRLVFMVLAVLLMLGKIPRVQIQATLNNIQITCFVAIALAESTTAVFLLKVFRLALRSSMTSPLSSGKLYRFLIRSTQIRIAMLALIGIGRAVTYPLRIKESKNKGVVTQLDTFLYTLEVLFPIVMFIDILASRLVSEDERRARSSDLGHSTTVDMLETRFTG
ncbi:hypothetical protein H9L39_17891 [Fusarium oxysporum f. sp. albedinis]|nr:hypothetical protein H9L39_17891 [Fusarium oxysporum f. sp. albedinis]